MIFTFCHTLQAKVKSEAGMQAPTLQACLGASGGFKGYRWGQCRALGEVSESVVLLQSRLSGHVRRLSHIVQRLDLPTDVVFDRLP